MELLLLGPNQTRKGLEFMQTTYLLCNKFEPVSLVEQLMQLYTPTSQGGFWDLASQETTIALSANCSVSHQLHTCDVNTVKLYIASSPRPCLAFCHMWGSQETRLIELCKQLIASNMFHTTGPEGRALGDSESIIIVLVQHPDLDSSQLWLVVRKLFKLFLISQVGKVQCQCEMENSQRSNQPFTRN